MAAKPEQARKTPPFELVKEMLGLQEGTPLYDQLKKSKGIDLSGSREETQNIFSEKFEFKLDSQTEGLLGKGEKIEIKTIKFRNESKAIFTFSLPDSPYQKLIVSYGGKTGKPTSNLRFVFSDDTPGENKNLVNLFFDFKKHTLNGVECSINEWPSMIDVFTHGPIAVHNFLEEVTSMSFLLAAFPQGNDIPRRIELPKRLNIKPIASPSKR